MDVRRVSWDVVERLGARLGWLPMTPPEELARGVGPGGFAAIGREFLGHFIAVGGLEPGHRVLDVGCGAGRMAIPLTGYLTRDACYRGLDVHRAAVAWCRNRITPRFPHFRFVWADLSNQTYNPTGSIAACDYRFPYRDGEFDFVFLTSVFTHMLPRDVAHFLAEIARVLRPGGRCFSTFFLWTPESEARVAAGQSSLAFRAELDGCRVLTRERPEDAIAYPEGWVRSALQSAGLRIREPVHYGAWAGREAMLTYQDIVVAEKAAASAGR